MPETYRSDAGQARQARKIFNVSYWHSGSRPRYEALLRKFAEQQEGAAEAMRAAVFAGDTATAERISHSLKGAAATLGAVALSHAAANAETAIKTGRGVEASIKSLSYALDPTSAAIAKALPQEGAGSSSSDTEGANASIKEPLIRLKQLLESDDGEAADFIVDAKARLKGVLTPAEIKTLAERIGNFDFEAALNCLSGIASRLCLNLEGK